MEDLEVPFCVILCQTGHCSEQPLRIKGHWDSPPPPSATEKRAMLQQVGERPELNPYPFVESEKAREAFAVMELKALTTHCNQVPKLQSPPASCLVPSH